MTVVRYGGTESQNRRPFGLSRPVVAVVSPSQVVDARRSVVTPPNSRYFVPRALAVNSTPLYVVLFCVENVTRLSTTALKPPVVSVYIEIGWPASGRRESAGVLMEYGVHWARSRFWLSVTWML